ncbi:MAG TPA: MFS transporter [Miltoncostaeaceae bacterium]|nr:MFS transporter [Miltoncostaeaceae bacterium]
MSTFEPRGNTRALALGTLAFTVSFYAWAMLGPLGPDLQDALGLSEVQLAVVIAVPVLMGSLMRIPLGVLTDALGARTVFTGLMAFTIVPLTALAIWHESFAAIVVFGFFLGFAGAAFAVGVPFVSKWYPRARQGAALGIYGMGMGGTVLAGLTAPRIVDRWGLTAPFVVAICLVAAMAVAFWILARDAPVARKPLRGGMLAPLRVFRDRPAAWAPTFYYFLVFGGFVAMFAYLPKLLHGVHGLDKPDAAARAAGFALVAVIARPIGGWLADRVGADAILRISFAATAVLAALLAPFYDQMVPLTILALTLAAAFGLGTGAVFKAVAHDFPDEVGAVTGVVGAAGGLGGFFPPLVMAFVKSTTGDYTLGFLLLAVTAVAALIVLQIMSRGRERVQAGDALVARR